MDSQEPQSILILDIEQLLTELNFLPLSDHKSDSKNLDEKNVAFSTEPVAWLNTPVKTSCF